MVDMNTLMDDETEKALAAITSNLIDAHIVYNDDKSELDVTIAIGCNSENVPCDDDSVFYYCENTNDLRSLLKGANGWETNGSDFYITAFADGNVTWEAK